MKSTRMIETAKAPRYTVWPPLCKPAVQDAGQGRRDSAGVIPARQAERALEGLTQPALAVEMRPHRAQRDSGMDLTELKLGRGSLQPDPATPNLVIPSSIMEMSALWRRCSS